MYTEFYGFTEKPFNLVPDPNYLYMSSRHEKALTFLEYGLTEKVGFVMLTGEIGIGKTTLIRHLLNQMHSDMDVAVVFHTNVDAITLLRQILSEFEIETNDAMSKSDILDLLYEFLIKSYASNRKVFVIIDEAQNLSEDALEELRMLSNLQTDKEMLLQIIIVGQPNLKDKIRNPSLQQFAQRISASYHMSAMTQEETASYIRHRLTKAGGEADLLKDEVIEGLFEVSCGIPRTINMLCDALLVYGYADRTKILTNELLGQVIEDKGGMGVFTPDTMETHPDSSEEMTYPDMNGRIRDLEIEVANLTMTVNDRMEEIQDGATYCRDTLISKLSTLYQQEKKKNAALIFKYGKLKERYEALQQSKYRRSEPILLEKIVQ